MKIGYFINQYPKPSHALSGGKSCALEARGNTVQRYALTCSSRELVDPVDLAEQAKTQHVFRQSPFHVCAAACADGVDSAARSLARHLAPPFAWAGGPIAGLVRHLAYFGRSRRLLRAGADVMRFSIFMRISARTRRRWRCSSTN